MVWPGGMSLNLVEEWWAVCFIFLYTIYKIFRFLFYVVCYFGTIYSSTTVLRQFQCLVQVLGSQCFLLRAAFVQCNAQSMVWKSFSLIMCVDCCPQVVITIIYRLFTGVVMQDTRCGSDMISGMLRLNLHSHFFGLICIFLWFIDEL